METAIVLGQYYRERQSKMPRLCVAGFSVAQVTTRGCRDADDVTRTLGSRECCLPMSNVACVADQTVREDTVRLGRGDFAAAI